MTQKKSQFDRDALIAATELAKVNKHVSRVGIAVGVIGIAATVSSLWGAIQQRDQFALQNQQLKLQNERLAEQKIEHDRVHAALEMIPEVVPEGLRLQVKFENKSGREIHLWMLGVRIFKADGFVSGATVKSHPQLLLHSESSIDECPASICPPGGTHQDKNYIHARVGGSVRLASGSVHKEFLGPYRLSEADLKAGVIIQGLAYPLEHDEGACVIVKPPSVPGALPRICEESRKNEPECWTHAKCPFEDVEVRFQLPASLPPAPPPPKPG
jgi:hypothetical protein